MSKSEKITIIEGPPPTFELVGDAWLMGLSEGPLPSNVALCRVRTANGPALVERCYRAWREQESIELEYRTEDGMTSEATILAVRWVEMPEGDILMLWVRLDDAEIEIEIDLDIEDYYDDEENDEEDDLGLIF
jgi:hypothetical protein